MQAANKTQKSCSASGKKQKQNNNQPVLAKAERTKKAKLLAQPRKNTVARKWQTKNTLQKKNNNLGRFKCKHKQQSTCVHEKTCWHASGKQKNTASGKVTKTKTETTWVGTHTNIHNNQHV